MKIESINNNNNEKVDPTKSSLLPDSLSLEKIKDSSDKKWNKYKERHDKKEGLYRDNETKEFFFSKENTDMPYEYFVTLLSKGILHVSDIVKKDDKLYSRKINLNEIKEKTSKEEIEAEFFMLGYVFEDWDKDSLIAHNHRLKNKKFAHFDYGKAFDTKNKLGFGYKDTGNISEKIIKQEINSITSGDWLKDVKEIIKEFPLHIAGHFLFLNKKELLNQILTKTKEFTERLNDTAFFNAVIKKSKIDLFSEQLSFLKEEDPIKREKEFQDIIKNRLFILQNTVNIILNEH